MRAVRIGIIFALCWALPIFAPTVRAQQSPVDPLQPPVAKAGRLEYAFGLAAAPGVTPVTPPGSTGPGPAVEAEYRLAFRGEAGYYLADTFALLAAWGSDGAVRRLFAAADKDASDAWSWKSGSSTVSAGAVWSVLPGRSWDLSAGVLWTFGGTGGATWYTSVRRIADPVAIQAGVSVQHDGGKAGGGGGVATGGGPLQIGFNGGVDFVFNDEFSVGAYVGHRLPVSGRPWPVTTLTLRLHRVRAFDGTGVEYDIVFTEQGGGAAVQLGVTWRGGKLLSGPR